MENISYDLFIDELIEVLDKKEVSFTNDKLSLYTLKEILEKDISNRDLSFKIQKVINLYNSNHDKKNFLGIKKKSNIAVIDVDWFDVVNNNLVWSFLSNERNNTFKFIGDNKGNFLNIEFVNKNKFGRSTLSYIEKFVDKNQTSINEVMGEVAKFYNDYMVVEYGHSHLFPEVVGKVSENISYSLYLPSIVSLPNVTLVVPNNITFEHYLDPMLGGNVMLVDYKDDILKRTEVITNKLPTIYKDKVFKK